MKPSIIISTIVAIAAGSAFAEQYNYGFMDLAAWWVLAWIACMSLSIDDATNALKKEQGGGS